MSRAMEVQVAELERVVAMLRQRNTELEVRIIRLESAFTPVPRETLKLPAKQQPRRQQ